jgi:PilZ domain
MIRRRQPRIKGILPVRICGIDGRGESFSEHSCTATISVAGASLLGVRASLAEGETIELQYRNRQARFRVVWIVPAKAAPERHIGLECLKPEKDFWPITLPSEDPEALQQLYDSPNGRRSHRRFSVSGTAYVSRVGAGERSPAKLGDISLSGCCLETSRPNYVGQRVKLWIRIGHTELEALAVVRVRDALTMGIEFTFMTNVHRRTLERLIINLKKFDAPKQGQQQEPVQHSRLTPF